MSKFNAAHEIDLQILDSQQKKKNSLERYIIWKKNAKREQALTLNSFLIAAWLGLNTHTAHKLRNFAQNSSLISVALRLNNSKS